MHLVGKDGLMISIKQKIEVAPTLRVMMSSLLAHFRHLDMFAMFMPAQAQGVARLGSRP